MKIKETHNAIFNDLLEYKLKYGLIKGLFKYLVDFYGGKFSEKKK